MIGSVSTPIQYFLTSREETKSVSKLCFCFVRSLLMSVTWCYLMPRDPYRQNITFMHSHMESVQMNKNKQSLLRAAHSSQWSV